MKTFVFFSDFISHSLRRRVHAINERDNQTNQDFYLFICRSGYQTTIVKDPGTRLLIGLFWSRVQTKCCYGKAELEVSVHLRGAGIYNVYLSFSKSK